MDQELQQVLQTAQNAYRLWQAADQRGLNDPNLKQECDRCFQKLWDCIYASPSLVGVRHPAFQKFNNLAEDAYHSTFVYLLEYLRKNLDRYKPEKGSFMTWFNFLMTHRVNDVIQRDRLLVSQEVCLDPMNPKHDKADQYDHNSLMTEDNKNRYDLDKINEIVARDRDIFFRGTHLRNRPDINLQSLYFHKSKGLKDREIADFYSTPSDKISPYTINCFWNRKKPLLKKKIEQEIQNMDDVFSP